jgi:hypothetical protein
MTGLVSKVGSFDCFMKELATLCPDMTWGLSESFAYFGVVFKAMKRTMRMRDGGHTIRESSTNRMFTFCLRSTWPMATGSAGGQRARDKAALAGAPYWLAVWRLGCNLSAGRGPPDRWPPFGGVFSGLYCTLQLDATVPRRTHRRSRESRSFSRWTRRSNIALPNPL